jgi:hypothetical protein
LWHVTPENLSDRLCRVANRNLSLTEWEQYLPGQPYRKICPTLPADPALLAEARALARNGDKAGAEASFRQLGELDPELLPDPEGEANHYLAAGALDRAAELARKGDDAAALTELEQAILLDPKLDFNPEEKLPELKSEALVAAGLAQARQGNLEQALDTLNQARDIGPSLETGPLEETARLLAARYFAEQGRQAAANDDLETAVVQYRQTIRIDPSFPVDAPEGEARRQNARHLLATARSMAVTGEITPALTALAAAQTVDPGISIPAQLYSDICRAGVLAQQADVVLETCHTAVNAAPYDGYCRDSRGMARALTGDLEGAIEDFDFFVNWFAQDPRFATIGLERERWITVLEGGKNPLDTETLYAVSEE